MTMISGTHKADEPVVYRIGTFEGDEAAAWNRALAASFQQTKWMAVAGVSRAARRERRQKFEFERAEKIQEADETLLASRETDWYQRWLGRINRSKYPRNQIA